jgi:Zn-dependent M28 family amino/carboxypeptidase
MILAEEMSPRDSEHPQNLDRVASYISNHFVEAHGEVVRQPFVVNGKTYQNIIARFGPQIGERIVVGAHYDTAGEFPGSDDNASAVAGLLELAVLLGSASLDTRVDLVAFTLEEPPYFNTNYMGSAVHAYSLKKLNVAVRAMICLEMIGFFTDAPNSQRLPLPLMDLLYPTKGNFVAVIGKIGQGDVVRRVKKGMRISSALPVYSFNAPASMPGINLSDHINYWKQGYAAVMVTDTAFMRNSRYHTAEDKPDTLDYERMAMTVQGVYAAVLEIAGN